MMQQIAPGLSHSELLQLGPHLLRFLEPSQLAPPTQYESLWGMLIAATAVNLCILPGLLMTTDTLLGYNAEPEASSASTSPKATL